jgi:hypothetical protein
MTEPLQGVTIDYTNWRGERRVRQIIPLFMDFGSNEWHPEPQWLLSAIDEDDCKQKTFAMKNVHAWTPKREGGQ